jgi:hypothetical protein
MRIYLGESIFPSFDDDNLVFSENEIEFGDWKDTRKTTVNVPMSEVDDYRVVMLTDRRSKITVPYLPTFFFRKQARLQIALTQTSTQNSHSIPSRVTVVLEENLS